MKLTRVVVIAGLMLSLLIGVSAWAAKTGIVDVEDLELRDGPSAKNQVVEKLKKGLKVVSSNVSVEGYFKVRTPSGKVGFVPADTLIFGVVDPSAPGAEGEKEKSASKKDGKEIEPVIRLRVLGGGTYFALGDVQKLFSTPGNTAPLKELKTGFHYGGEVNYILIPSLFVIIRVEQIQKTIFLRDSTTRYTFDMTVSGIPTTTGIGIRLVKAQTLSVNLGLMGGLGFSTQLSSTAQSLPTPNVTVYSDTPFAGLARLEGIWHVTRLIGIFAEGGYRYLRSKEMPTPTLAGSGREIFQVSGQFSKIQVDLSGVFASAGLTVSF